MFVVVLKSTSTFRLAGFSPKAWGAHTSKSPIATVQIVVCARCSRIDKVVLCCWFIFPVSGFGRGNCRTSCYTAVLMVARPCGQDKTRRIPGRAMFVVQASAGRLPPKGGTTNTRLFSYQPGCPTEPRYRGESSSESRMSKTPPKPGSHVLESLTPTSRLRNDSARSPNMPAAPTNRPKTIQPHHRPGGRLRSLQSSKGTGPRKRRPGTETGEEQSSKCPFDVLPGLISGAILWRPISRPTGIRAYVAHFDHDRPTPPGHRCPKVVRNWTANQSISPI